MSVMPQRRWRWWRRRLCLCEIWLKKKPPAPKFPLTCFTMPHTHSAKYFSQPHFIRSVRFILNFYKPFHCPASQIISFSRIPSGMGKMQTQNCSKTRKIVKVCNNLRSRWRKKSIFALAQCVWTPPFRETATHSGKNFSEVEAHRRAAACHWGNEWWQANVPETTKDNSAERENGTLMYRPHQNCCSQVARTMQAKPRRSGKQKLEFSQHRYGDIAERCGSQSLSYSARKTRPGFPPNEEDGWERQRRETLLFCICIASDCILAVGKKG